MAFQWRCEACGARGTHEQAYEAAAAANEHVQTCVELRAQRGAQDG